jgi:adenylate cyclase
MLFLGTAAVLTGFVLAAYAADVLRDSELDTVDARFSIRGGDEAPDDVVVVAIDDVTFDELDERWPFPRSLHARAVDRLRQAGVKAIAYDVQFTEPSDDPEEDNALIDAVARTGNTVLATTEVDDRGGSNIFGGEDVLRDIGARAGNANYTPDSGGVIRRMPYELDKLKGFGVVAAELYSGRRITREDAGDDTPWIDWSGSGGTVETVSFSRLVRGRVPAERLRGKVAVVGATAPSLQDLHPTAVSEIQPGAEVQAESIVTALDAFPISEAPGAVDVILIVLLGLVGPLTALRFGPLRAAIAGVIVAGVYAVAVQLAFNSGTIVDFLFPEGSLLLNVVGALGVGLVLDAFERERVRDLFSRFVPEPVVDEVLAHADEDLRLGGERREVTVLFSDIRGFTTFSETREPEVVIEVLNRYLTDMTDVILRHGGTLVAFIGDGIMAVFGAPIEMEDHADRAVATAREMSGPALESFNEWLRGTGHGDGFRIGVGLNAGPVMAGNVGSEKRLDYTAIGDVVNTASRIEGMTKGTPHMVFFADTVRDLMKSDPDDLQRVDEMEVRGRASKVVIWSLQ